MPVVRDAPGDMVGASDRDEFHQFLVSRWPRLVRLAYGLTGDVALAEDITRDVLARASAAWRRVRRADDPDAHIRKALVTACLRRLRRRRPATPGPAEPGPAEPGPATPGPAEAGDSVPAPAASSPTDPASVLSRPAPAGTGHAPVPAGAPGPDRPGGPGDDADAAPPGTNEAPALLDTLAQLPPRQRAVIVLRYWEDLTDAQVASVLGRTVGTVRSQAARGLVTLRRSPALARGGPDEGSPGHIWQVRR